MRADPTGTPSEQVRARHGWRPMVARGPAPLRPSPNARCETCAHVRWPETTAAGPRKPAPRCARMSNGAYMGDTTGMLATQITAICDDWARQPERPQPTRQERIRALRRQAVDIAYTPRERADAQHELDMLTAQESTDD